MKQGVEGLRDEFLPHPFDPLGTYAKGASVQLQTRAFVVLSHAEVEAYLEDWAKAIAKAAETIWLSKGRFTPPLVCLHSSFSPPLGLPTAPTGPQTKDIPQRLSAGTVKLFERYYKQIKNNHGVKEQNILDLFAPLGIPLSVLGSTLLPNLDNFGNIRGMHAHQSAKAVVSVLDPETEYKRVTDLLMELIGLDNWLVERKRHIR